MVLAEHDVFQRGQMRHEPNVLKRAGNAVAHALRHRVAGDVLPKGLNAALVYGVNARDQVEHGGLARAIGANERGAAALGHAKRHVVDDLQAAKGLAHAIKLQGITHGDLLALRPGSRASIRVRVITPWGRHIMSSTTAKPNTM